MSDAPLRSRKLVEELWSEADAPPPLDTEVRVPATLSSDDLRQHPELAYLNRHWVWEAGGVGSWLRAKLAGLVGRLLERYLLDERAFVERLVRFQNDLAKRCDELAGEVHGLAAAQRALVEAVDERLERLERRASALHGALEARLERLEEAAKRDDPPR